MSAGLAATAGGSVALDIDDRLMQMTDDETTSTSDQLQQQQQQQLPEKWQTCWRRRVADVFSGPVDIKKVGLFSVALCNN